MRDRNRNARHRHKPQAPASGSAYEKKYVSEVGVRSEMKLETPGRPGDGPAPSPGLKEQYPKE